MTLTEEERARIGVLEEHDMEDGAEAEGLRQKTKDKETRAAKFARSIEASLATIEDEIDALLQLEKIKPGDAAIHRIYVQILRAPDTRPGDRLKATEGLAKLRGLFVQHVVSHGGGVDVRNIPTAALLDKLLEHVGLAALAHPPAKRLTISEVTPESVQRVDSGSVDKP